MFMSIHLEWSVLLQVLPVPYFSILVLDFQNIPVPSEDQSNSRYFYLKKGKKACFERKRGWNWGENLPSLNLHSGRHGKGPPGYGPGPDLGPFFTNLDRTAVLFLGLERTWKVPDFLQMNRPVLFKFLKEDFQSISKKNSNFRGLFVYFSFKWHMISSPYWNRKENNRFLLHFACVFNFFAAIIRKIDVLKGQKMDLESDLGPFKICGKYRTEGPFLAEDRWPDLGPKKLDTLRYHACIPVPKTLIIWVLVPILTSSTIDKKTGNRTRN